MRIIGSNARLAVAGALCAAGLAVGTTAPAFAQTNGQNGLVNVNLQNLALAVPVSVAVPVGVAANVCGVSVLSAATAGHCTATTNAPALSDAVAAAMTGTGGGPGNSQTGLVNVNVQNLALAVPVSVAVPVGVAANVCGVSVASVATAGQCSAQTTSTALSQALGRALAA